jgi:hypothetical protein
MKKGDGKLRLKNDEPYDHDGCMTFTEIGRALGITSGGAWMVYCRAIRKLRRKKAEIRQLRELADSKDFLA